MAELLTRAEFARLTGIDKSAVTHAVKARRIPSTEDGRIDTGDPTVIMYMESHRLSAKASGGGRGRPILGGAHKDAEVVANTAAAVKVRAITSVEDEELSGLDAASKGKVLQNRLVAEKLKEKRLANLKEVDALVPRVLVKRGFSVLVSTLEQHFRTMDESAAIEIDALVRAGKGKAEIAEYLRREIDAAVKSFSAASKRAIRDLKNDGAE